ncbi:MAG: polymer-forming cytoskeletal protein [Patescibacteria group bacterium]|jgi:cytoskeletal protein CcmA (bactofilin family)
MNEQRASFGGGSGAATLIAHGVRVEGDFSSQGDVSIEGEVHGAVKITGRLSVGSQAMLKADVTADQATVAGTIEGNLTVANHLDITATAKITGDVVCETATVESGAVLNGKVMIGAKPVSKPPKSNAESKPTPQA